MAGCQRQLHFRTRFCCLLICAVLGNCRLTVGLLFQVLAALGLSNAVALTRQMHVRARFIPCPIAYLLS